MMMEGRGIEVIDLGIDVSAKAFVDTARKEECDLICCSALLTTTMTVLAEVVQEVGKSDIKDQVKVMIGGAPVSEVYCMEIGADYYTQDAISAAELAAKLCHEKYKSGSDGF